jgi:hypothetical protein
MAASIPSFTPQLLLLCAVLLLLWPSGRSVFVTAAALFSPEAYVDEEYLKGGRAFVNQEFHEKNEIFAAQHVSLRDDVQAHRYIFVGGAHHR